jgi:hypothetical protein
MGQSAAETVKEIEEVRERLQHDLGELQDRLPQPAVWAKRAVGVALGGGVAGSMLWFVMRRRKKSRQPEFIQPVVKVLPDEVVDAVRHQLEDDRWKAWAMGLGGAWLLFRLAELRQLRRLATIR